MIPTLYEEYEDVFLSNGLGRLADAISCVITQNKAGAYELVMVYPLDGIHAEEITNNRIIYAKPERGKASQPFKIRNIEKTLDGRMKITARHNCYDLNYYACKEFGQTDVVPYQITPSLYDSNEDLIGVLTDMVMYYVEVGTSKWTLKLTYPYNGTYSAYLNTNNFIYAQPTIGRDLVMFDITNVSNPTGSTTTTSTVKRAKQTGDVAGTTTSTSTDPVTGAVTVTTVTTSISGNTTTITTTITVTTNGNYVITAQADIVPYVPTEYNKMTVTQALGYVKSYADEIQECPFTFTADPSTAGDSWITSQRTFWSDIPKAVKPLLQGSEGSILDVFGGEWEYDHYNCILHEKRGADNGVQYRYGKNITSISERVNIDEIYTHAFSFWKGTASSSTDTEEGEYYTKTGSIINILNSDYAAMFPTQRTLIIDASDNYEKEPTAEQLDAYTRKYVSNHSSGTPTVTIEVSIVDLANTKEYEDIAALEEVNLYDTVTIVFPSFGVNVKSKVTEIEFDVLKEKNNHVIIGDVTTKLSNIIAKNKSDIVKTKADLKKWADKAMERATEALAGWNGGNIRKNYNATDHKQQSMYIMNTDNMDDATKSIKFDGFGIGVSGNGAEGDYKQMVNMSGDKVTFSDEFAQDGNTNASFLKRGTIKSGSSYWDITANRIYLELIGLLVEGSATINENLSVGGNESLNGNLNASGSLNGNALNVSGAMSGDSISANSASISGDADIDGSLTIGSQNKNVENILDDFEERITRLENA